MKRESVIGAMAWLLLALAPEAGAVQPSDPKPTERLVSWDLTLESGKTISMTARAGDLARVTVDERTLALAPAVEDSNDQVVVFRLIEVKKVDDTNEVLRQVEKFTIQSGASYTTAWTPPLTIRLKGVKEGSAEGQRAARAFTGPVGDSLIAWEVRFASSAPPVKLMGREGQMTRLTGGGYELGITPKIVGANSVGFRVFAIKRVGEAEALREIGSMTLLTGTERTLSIAPNMTLKLTAIRPSS